MIVPVDLPPLFLERLKPIVPADRFEDVVRSFSEPHVTSFRVNPILGDREQVLWILSEAGLHVHPVDWFPDAFWIEPEEREMLLRSEPYLRQQVYVQNLSSMIPPLVLDPAPGERVLDLAAAPGSKTLQIAAQMHNEGEIAAVEVVKSRFFKLRDNLNAQGATSVRTFLKDGTTVWRFRPEYFDRVLLDAPCTTEGRFSSDETETMKYWSLRKISEMSHKQRKLLYSAVQSLAPGGTLVYSTCTFAPEENEMVVEKTLKTFDGKVRLVPVNLDIPGIQPGLTEWQGKSFRDELQYGMRILPDRKMEGFFLCKLEKTDHTLERASKRF